MKSEINTNNKPEFSEELKKTYSPYWEEMEALHKKDRNSRGMFMAEMESIIARCHNHALEIGYNAGWKFSLNQLMNLIEMSAFSVEVKELLRQMIEIQKEKI